MNGNINDVVKDSRIFELVKEDQLCVTDLFNYFASGDEHLASLFYTAYVLGFRMGKEDASKHLTEK